MFVIVKYGGMSCIFFTVSILFISIELLTMFYKYDIL